MTLSATPEANQKPSGGAGSTLKGNARMTANDLPCQQPLDVDLELLHSSEGPLSPALKLISGLCPACFKQVSNPNWGLRALRYL